jgi:hypothetical protein
VRTASAKAAVRQMATETKSNVAELATGAREIRREIRVEAADLVVVAVVAETAAGCAGIAETRLVE